MKMIYTEHGVVGRIAGLLGVSSAFVTMALKYKRDSPLAKRIRHMAIKDFINIAFNQKYASALHFVRHIYHIPPEKIIFARYKRYGLGSFLF